MSLKAKLNEDLKAAMKAKDQAALRTIRSIKAAIMVAETSEGRSGAPLSEEEEMQLLVKQAKQRRDSADHFRASERDDLLKIEEEELAVIESYLPKPLSPEELQAAVKDIVAEVGATSIKDMGKVMGVANQRFMGRADGKALAAIVKQALM